MIDIHKFGPHFCIKCRASSHLHVQTSGAINFGVLVKLLRTSISNTNYWATDPSFWSLITIKFSKSSVTRGCHGLGSDSGGVESTTTRAGSQGFIATCSSFKYTHSGWLENCSHQWHRPWTEPHDSLIWWVERNEELSRRHVLVEMSGDDSRRPWCG